MSDTESDHDYDTRADVPSEDDKLIESSNHPPSLDDILRLLEIDDDAFDHISELSMAVADCLDLILKSRAPGSRQRAICAFRRLVTVSALDRLLRLRSKLRADGPTSKRFPYTCINSVLAKLGVLVLLVVGDLDQQKDYAMQGGTLESQMERDAVLAAGQLPGAYCWNMFPSALRSSHLSPAAKRLILSLLFGVLVVQPDLGGRGADNPYETQVIIDALETSIGEYVQFDSLTGSFTTLRSIVDCALILNLFATLNAAQGQVSTPSRNCEVNKPYMGTHLLALIDSVLCSTNDPCGNAVERVARAVCFHWGRLVPWSWTTWADYRLANAEVVTIMTIRWLQSLKCRGMCLSHRECAPVAAHLAENVPASLIALSNALFYVVTQLVYHNGNQYLSSQLLDKACFFLSTILHEINHNGKPGLHGGLQGYISRITWSVLHLCVIRPRPSELESGGGDISSQDGYLELLLAMDKTVVQQCLMELQAERHFQFSSKTDYVFSEAKAVLNEDLILTAHMSMIRFALGFLTFLCNTGIRGIILRENISSLFTRLYDRLIVGSQRDEYGEMLLGPMITAITAAEKYFNSSKPFHFLISGETFWRLCLRGQNEKFSTSLALAQYIIHGNYPRKWLLLSETLDHFRTIILAIIRQWVPRDQEQIFQLACPTFCLAMVQLLAETIDAESQAVKRFFMNSPWTVVFCAELRGLLYPEWALIESGLYRDVTRQVMGDIGMLLLQVLSDNNGRNSSRLEVADFNTKLLLYESQVMMITTSKRVR